MGTSLPSHACALPMMICRHSVGSGNSFCQSHSTRSQKPFKTCERKTPFVLGVCRFLEEQGFQVTCLPVDRQCRVDPERVLEAFPDDTLIVSVMLANNETGTLQPVAEIARLVKSKRPDVLVHTDAAQAIAKVPLMFRSWAWICWLFRRTSFTAQRASAHFSSAKALRLRRCFVAVIKSTG